MFEKLKNSLSEWLTHEEPFPGVPLCDFERIMYEIRPCDVLLIEGRSRVSRVINQVTQSHMGNQRLKGQQNSSQCDRDG